MRWIALPAAFAALLLPAFDAPADRPAVGDQAGDIWEIGRVRETSSEDSDGSSSESHSSALMVERVIAVRPDGLELEYDLPGDADGDDRAREWTLPARIFRPHRGEPQLLNRTDLESRLEVWLKRGKFTRAACGRWIFTWNAFQIECDPQSVIETIRAYDLRLPDIREGALYQEPEGRGPVALTRKAAGPQGTSLAAEMELDPEVARRERGENDVVVAELSGENLTVERALEARAKEVVSGTISVTLDIDPAGRLRRLTRITKAEIRYPDGRVETRTGTETLERRRLPAAPPKP